MGWFSRFFGAIAVGALFAAALAFTGGTAFGLAPQFFNLAFFQVAGAATGLGIFSRHLAKHGQRDPNSSTSIDPTSPGANVRSAIPPARWSFGLIRTRITPAAFWDSSPWRSHWIYPISSGRIDSLHLLFSNAHGRIVPLVRGVQGYAYKHTGFFPSTDQWIPFGPRYSSGEGSDAWQRYTGVLVPRNLNLLDRPLRTLLSMGEFLGSVTESETEEDPLQGQVPKSAEPLIKIQECFDDRDKPAGPNVDNAINRFRYRVDGNTIVPMHDYPLDANSEDNGYRPVTLHQHVYPNGQNWGPAHIGLGISYLYMQLQQSEADNWAETNQVCWRSGPDFEAVHFGNRFVDPRITVAAAHGRTETRINAAERWTANSALVQAQILMQFREIDPKDIDIDALYASAALCNETILWHDWPGEVPSDEATPSLASDQARSLEPGQFAIWQQSRGPKSTGQLRRLYRGLDQSSPTEMAAVHPNRAALGRVSLEDNDPDKRDAFNVFAPGVSEVIHKRQVAGGGEYSVNDPNSGIVPLWYITPWYWTDTNANQVGPGQARLYFKDGDSNGEIYVCDRSLPNGYWTDAIRRRAPNTAHGWRRLNYTVHKRLPQGLTDAEKARWPGLMYRYRAHGQVISGDSLLDMMEHIDDSMQGTTTEGAGKYYIRAGGGESLTGTLPQPVATLTDADLLRNGLGAYQSEVPDEQIITDINISLLQDQNLGWRASQLTVTDTAREARKKRKYKGDARRLDVVTNTAQARAFANSLLIQNQRRSFSARFTPRIGDPQGRTPFADIIPGDIVRCHLSQIGWHAQLNPKFFLYTVERSVLHPDGALELDLVSWHPHATFYDSPSVVDIPVITAPRPRHTQVTPTVPVTLRFNRITTLFASWDTQLNITYNLPRTVGSQSGVDYSMQNLPAGMTYDRNRHAVVGTPTTDGTGTATLTARKGVESASLTVQWRVFTTPVIRFGSGTLSFEWNITDTVRVPLPRLTNEPLDVEYSVAGLPAGITFNSATHVIEGSPTDEGSGRGLLNASYGTGNSRILRLDWIVSEEVTPTFIFAESSLEFEWSTREAIDYPLPRVLNAPPGIMYSVTGLPAAVRYDSANHKIIGTPDAVSAGTSHTGSLTATHGTDQVTLDLSWSVAAISIISVAPPPLEFPTQELEFNWDTSEAVSYLLPRVNGSQSGVIYGAEDLPSGITYNYDTHMLEGAPDAIGDGTSEFIAVRGNEEVTIELLWSILRMGSPLPFAFTAEGRTFSWNTDEVINYVLPQIPGEQTGIVYAVTGLPTGVTFTAATRTLSGTPDASAAGTGTATLTATHGTDTDTLDIAWTVVDTTTPPLKFDVETLTTAWETTTNINVALPRVIGTQDGVTYTVTGLPIGARYNQNRHRIEGLPAMDGTGMAILFAAREGIGAEVVITWAVTTPVILQFPNTGDTVEWDILTDVTYQLPRTVTEPSGLVYSLTGLPNGIQWNETTHSLSGRPAVTSVGTSGSIILTATHDTETTNFNIAWSIQGIEFGQTRINMGRDVGEDNPFALPRVLENVAGITYAMTDLPAGMTYDDTAHTIAGAPTLAGTGIATLTATLHASTATLAVHWVVEELALALSEFDDSGLDVHTSALLTASDDRAWFATDVRGGSDTSTLALDGAPITRIRKQNDNGLILINDDTAELVMRDFFGTAATRSEWTVYIQTRTGVAFTDNIQGAGTNYVRMEFTDPLHQEILNTIRTGTPFIFAVAKTAVLLQLADFDETDLNVDAKALITASDDVDWYVAPSRFGSDSVTDGELGLGVGQTVIDRIKRFSADSSIVILNDSDVPVALNLRDYFGVEAGLQRDAGWTLYIQTKQGVASTNTVFNSGGGYVNMQFEDNTEILDGITEGTRFIAAIARPVVFEFATETFPITGNIFEALAVVLPRIPDEPVGTTYTLSNPPTGLTFSAANHNLTGTFSPTLRSTSGTSVLTATQGTRTATLNIEWSVPEIQGFEPSFANYHWNTASAVDITLPVMGDQLGSVTVTYSIEDLPQGLSFDAATRRITGTPTAAGNGNAVMSAFLGTHYLDGFFVVWDVVEPLTYRVYASTINATGDLSLTSVDFENPGNSAALTGSVSNVGASAIAESNGILYAVSASALHRIDPADIDNATLIANINIPESSFSVFIHEEIIYVIARGTYYTITLADIENMSVDVVDANVSLGGRNSVYAATQHLGRFYWIDQQRQVYRAESSQLSGVRIGRLDRVRGETYTPDRVAMFSAEGKLYVIYFGKLYIISDGVDFTVTEVGDITTGRYWSAATVTSYLSTADIAFEVNEISYAWRTGTTFPAISVPRVLGSQDGVTYFARDLPAGIVFGDGGHLLTGAPTELGSGTANLFAQKGDMRTSVSLHYVITPTLGFSLSSTTPSFRQQQNVNTRTPVFIDLPRAGPRDTSVPGGIAPELPGTVYTYPDLPAGLTYNAALHRVEGTPARSVAGRNTFSFLRATLGTSTTSIFVRWNVAPITYEDET